MRRAVLVGFLTGALGVTIATLPACSAAEDDLGLGWMFWVRGSIEPQNVALVSMTRLLPLVGLAGSPKSLPRAIHARSSTRGGTCASAIAF